MKIEKYQEAELLNSQIQSVDGVIDSLGKDKMIIKADDRYVSLNEKQKKHITNYLLKEYKSEKKTLEAQFQKL